MQVNLTFGDAILSLLIGFLGSLLAGYVFIRFSEWVATASTWWSFRSQKSAQVRVKRLSAEVDRIAALSRNQGHHLGVLGARLGRLIVLAVLFLVGFVALVMTILVAWLDTIRATVDSGYTMKFDLDKWSLLIFLVGGALLPMLLWFLWTGWSIDRDADLEQRKAALTRQIRRLNERWSIAEPPNRELADNADDGQGSAS